ncbi:MAG: BON domain-containing protein [Hydrogenophaga sp.]|jgi:hyperosmotically inducible periplasmic protein|uniref:BON domain-containing protein n=1 Tax=Hydrogenophaga sp. TaxID=1904254 RepID=UPI002625AE03|nr:BON domain-containing protein [Hydrogenophaga sp.]MCV0439116.1 BON domain-containing protein [Hydrogenophaga sp.]
MKRTTRYTALAAAALASTLIMACGQQEDATVGQRLDGAVESTKDAGTELRADTRDAAQDLKAAGSSAADTLSETGERMASGAADMAITAKVNAALAGDAQLSALKIDVDTSNGMVELKGTAPDAASRDRATMLASAVEGVQRVENRLTVESKG